MSTPFKLDCNVGQLVQMMDSGKINYDGAIQRGYVWDKKRKSRLIRSIILKRAIGMLNFNQVRKNSYEALDGKQRSNAIYEFKKGRFAISSGIPPAVDDEGNAIEIARHKFEDLPDFIQEQINSYGLIIYCYDNLTEEEKQEIFEDINNGKPVTGAETTLVGVKSRKVIQALARHSVFDTLLSASNKKKNLGEILTIQMWSMCYNENASLLNKHLAPILATTEVTEEQRKQLVKVLDYLGVLLLGVRNNKELFRKMRAKTHIVSLAYMSFLAINKGMSESEFSDKAEAFFTCDDNKATNSERYNLSVTSGSAKAEQVKMRKYELEKALS